jgi:hypothetical protein
MTKVGPCEVSVYRTSSDSLHLFRAEKEFPATDTWQKLAEHVKVKFMQYDQAPYPGEIGDNISDELKWDILDKLWGKIRLHHLAVFQFVAAALNAHINTVGDGTDVSRTLESKATAHLVSAWFPDFVSFPITEILKQRNDKRLIDIRRLISKIADGVRAGNQLLSDDDRIAQEALRSVMEDFPEKLVNPKEYVIKLPTGIAGFVPFLGYLTGIYDIAMNTKEFI